MFLCGEYLTKYKEKMCNCAPYYRQCIWQYTFMIGVVNFFEMLDTSFITTLKTEEVGSSETSEHSSTLKSHPHGTGSKVKVRYS